MYHALGLVNVIQSCYQLWSIQKSCIITSSEKNNILSRTVKRVVMRSHEMYRVLDDMNKMVWQLLISQYSRWTSCNRWYTTKQYNCPTTDIISRSDLTARMKEPVCCMYFDAKHLWRAHWAKQTQHFVAHLHYNFHNALVTKPLALFFHHLHDLSQCCSIDEFHDNIEMVSCMDGQSKKRNNT